MAKIPTYDPLSGEARSPLIAGLTTAANKISEILDMGTEEYTDLELEEVPILEDKVRLLYQAPIDKKLWLQEPAPVIKVNGEVKAEGFDLDYFGGSVRFDEPLNDGDTVTATATGIKATSTVLSGLLDTVNALKPVTEHYKGYFDTETSLTSQHPTGESGDFAVVGDSLSVWLYDSKEGSWKDPLAISESEITAAYKEYAVHQDLSAE